MHAMEYKPDKTEINLLVGRSGCIINEMKKKVLAQLLISISVLLH